MRNVIPRPRKCATVDRPYGPAPMMATSIMTVGKNLSWPRSSNRVPRTPPKRGHQRYWPEITRLSISSLLGSAVLDTCFRRAARDCRASRYDCKTNGMSNLNPCGPCRAATLSRRQAYKMPRMVTSDSSAGNCGQLPSLSQYFPVTREWLRRDAPSIDGHSFAPYHAASSMKRCIAQFEGVRRVVILIVWKLC